MRFLGAPAGYEFMSLIEAIVLAGGDDTWTVRRQPGARRECIGAARHQGVCDADLPALPARRHAWPTRWRWPVALITATCVEATEFLDLSQTVQVTGVPKTVVNGEVEILGALPEDMFVRAVLQQPMPEPPSDSA